MSTITIDEFQLKRVIAEAVTSGVKLAFSEMGKIPKNEISEREAYRKFGQAKVKSWVARGKVSRIKIGERNSKVTYSLAELEAAALSEKIIIHKLK